MIDNASLTDAEALSYIAAYPDLIVGLGNDAAAGRAHYALHGAAEGRTSRFDGAEYARSAPDLLEAFGADPVQGAVHYILHGHAEGRIARYEPDPALRATPERYLTLCTIIRDEGRDLAEWLCFHRAAGVEHFLIYDHKSQDDTRQIVRAFERQFPGTVTLITWVGEYNAQIRAYNDAIYRCRSLTTWLAFIDGDEFLFGAEEDLKTILRDFESAAALAVHWVNYGSSDHIERPSALCIDAFTRRAPDASKIHRMIKSILQPMRATAFGHPHSARLTGDMVNERGTVLEPAADRADEASYERIRINHYRVKSFAEWRSKQSRGRFAQGSLQSRGDDYFTTYDRNEIEDPSAQRFHRDVTRAMASMES